MFTIGKVIEERNRVGLTANPVNLFISPEIGLEVQQSLRGLFSELPLKGQSRPTALAAGCYWYIDPDEPNFRVERR